MQPKWLNIKFQCSISIRLNMHRKATPRWATIRQPKLRQATPRQVKPRQAQTLTESFFHFLIFSNN